ncbi:hypothetical protein ACFSSA_07885 [Luteolibacter algae]|uniref:Uncharacterized protein n=1 Tax=Luteolibacter algae TaxID=454151 RepID=A0ABW5D936_9BACT
MSKAVLSASAIFLTFAMFAPYIRSIHRGTTKPHVFSWVIWGFGTFIVFFAQLAGRGGIGAWPIGVSGIISAYIAIIAFVKRPEFVVTKLDWVFFFVALSALPFWFVTSDPLWAVIILTFADTVGFGPTFRKAYEFPYEESIVFFILSAVRNSLVILALEHHSFTTVLFPAVVGIGCLLLVCMIAYRRMLVSDPDRSSKL